jgi:hypothetical protein
VAVVFPRLASLADRITVEPALLDAERYLGDALRPYGVEADVDVVEVEPTEPEITHAAARAAEADATVAFLYDAHLYPSNRRLLDALQTTAQALAVVLMRDPYDAEYLAPRVGAISAFGWRKCQLDAVLARLLAAPETRPWDFPIEAPTPPR